MSVSGKPDSRSAPTDIRPGHGGIFTILVLIAVLAVWPNPSFSGDLSLKHSPTHWLKKIPAVPDELSNALLVCPEIRSTGSDIDAAQEALREDAFDDDMDDMSEMDEQQIMARLMAVGNPLMMQAFAEMQSGIAGETQELINRLQPHLLQLEELKNELEEDLNMVGEGLPDCSLIEHVPTADKCFVSNTEKKNERRLKAANSYLAKVQSPLAEMESSLRPFLEKWESEIVQIEAGSKNTGLLGMLMKAHRAGMLDHVINYAWDPKNRVCSQIIPVNERITIENDK